MTWLWTILPILTVLNLIWLFWAIWDDDDSIGASVFVLLVIVGLVGWVGFGLIANAKFETKEFEYTEITKSKTFILITNHNDYVLFEDKFDMENITDTTTFYHDRGINMYGGTAEHNEIFYYSYQDTIHKMDTSIVRYKKIKRIGEIIK